jgi:Pvc16 N-terminal domain
MSNFLAIATVTATLSQLIRAAIATDVDGATVSTLRPDGNGGNNMPEVGVNLYLYQVTPNIAWRNADLPTRNTDGQLVQRPRAAIDLHYLLTFYGNEARLEPQRLVGSVVRTLHTQPVLTRQMIRDTINNTSFDYLSASDLSEEIEMVKFTPLPLSLEELSKLWSVFFQTLYTLSLAYHGTVVLIESKQVTRQALPVRAHNVYVRSFHQPVIEGVESLAGKGQPIVMGGTLVIRGKRLRGDITKVRVGAEDVTPDIQIISDTEIIAPIPASLRAGVHGVQVIHEILMGKPPTPHSGVESNVAAFVLQPTIKRRPDDTDDITVSPPDQTPDHTRSVFVVVSPRVGAGQRTVLLMNGLTGAARSRAYSFANRPLTLPPNETDIDTIKFRISGVEAGQYLARVQVDGAESPLVTDEDPDDPKFIRPQVTIL